MADRRVDLLDEGVDLAIRLGPLEDSSFVSRRLTTGARMLVASPAYLAKRGAPASVAELQAHDIVLNRSPAWTSGRLRSGAGAETSIKLTARLVTTSMEGLMAAALAGLGIVAVSAFACRTELARGDLVRVLADHQLSPIDVHAVLPAGRRPPAKARAFIDHLAATLG
jgi:DNA-binding transcriptional LysR family regulator